MRLNRFCDQILAQHAPPETQYGKRVRELFDGFIAKLNPRDATHRAAALAAAELTIAAEDLRDMLTAITAGSDDGKPELTAQMSGLTAEVVKMEKCARCAREDVVALIPEPKSWLEQQQEEERREKRRQQRLEKKQSAEVTETNFEDENDYGEDDEDEDEAE